MSANPQCPECGSADLLFNEKKQQYICKDCGHTFQAEQEFVPLRVFISYGHDEHSALAERIRLDLKERGHAVWFDVERLKPGGDWEQYIEEGLEWAASDPSTGRVVLLMTPHSVRRPDGYCLNEIARALGRSLRPVPVMVVQCEPPLSICRIQWLDMQDCVPVDQRQARYEVKRQTLIDALERDRIDFEGTQARLLNLLEPLPFDADIERHLTRFIGREWDSQAIDRWLSDPDASRVFWLHGAPGVGKTAIAAWLCRNRREIAAFHLCRFGHRQKADPKCAVLSIAYQLSTQLPEYRDLLAALNLEQLVPAADAPTLFDRLITQPLGPGFPPPDRPVIILIDGLDEATEGNRNELAQFIGSEFRNTPLWLRLIVTSRPDREVTHPLQGLSSYVLDTSLPENEEDIRRFLRRELAPYCDSSEVPEDAIATILARSEGVFLYVEWVRQELQARRLSLSHLDQFPQGLGEVYARFFARQFPDTEAFRQRIRPALEVIAAARSPLRLDTIAGILAWDEYASDELVDRVGSLFLCAEDGVRPFHRSIIDWLTDRQKAGGYRVSAVKGHERLAQHGWDQYKVGVGRLSVYMLAHLPHHLIGAARAEELDAIMGDLAFTHAKAARMSVGDLVSDLHGAYRALSTGSVLVKTVDGLAASAHETYAGAVSGAAETPYADLDSDLQEQNRSFVVHVMASLALVELGVAPGRWDPLLAGALAARSEALAAAEHERWVGFKLEQGWRWGPSKDALRKTNPYMVPWDDLSDEEMWLRYGDDADRIGPGPFPEEVREYDRDMIRRIPRILEDAGYALVSLPEGPAETPRARDT